VRSTLQAEPEAEISGTQNRAKAGDDSIIIESSLTALLQERLKDKIEVDFDTARRLFTLICVLHLRA